MKTEAGTDLQLVVWVVVRAIFSWIWPLTCRIGKLGMSRPRKDGTCSVFSARVLQRVQHAVA